MSNQEFERLVHRLETEATHRPLMYQAKLAALASLAYLYISGVALLGVALLIGLGAAIFFAGPRYVLMKVIWKAGPLTVALLAAISRSFWVRLEAPPGIALDAARHPRLFAEVEALRQAAGAPRVHEIILNPTFNAAICQIPRLGLLGWPRNYLIVGLPLMKALSLAQFRSVLAHELGHLSGSHGRWSSWIYTSRQRWDRILEAVEADQHWASFLFKPFFRWYTPYFNAYSFVQARQQEYVADRISAELVGAETAGACLATARVRGVEYDAWWASIERRASRTPSPDVRPYSDLVFEGLEAKDEKEIVERSLNESTTVADTHPSLRDRLAALGAEAIITPVSEESAADALIGSHGGELIAELDGEWRDNTTEWWKARYRDSVSSRAELERIEEIPTEARSAEDHWAFASLSELYRRDSDPLSLYGEVLAADPAHPGAAYAVGRLLLNSGDAGGLHYLDQAAQADDEAIIPASLTATAFLQDLGRAEEAEKWAARGRAHQAKLDAAEEERSTIVLDGRWDRHGLDDAEVQEVVRFLGPLEGVDRAWILSRRLEHYPEFPLYLLAVRRRRSARDWLSSSSASGRNHQLQDLLADAPLGDFFTIVTNGLSSKERTQIESVTGAELVIPD